MAELARFADVGALARRLGADIVSRLGGGVDQRGRASLVVPGGATPGPVLDVLSAADLAWRHVEVTTGDERWAPADPAESNEALVRARLLHGRAAEARFVCMNPAAANADEAALQVEAMVAEMARPFDVMLLGMGADGHTASLFPHSSKLGALLDPDAPALVARVDAPGARGSSLRLTLTWRAILGSRFIAVMITGADKLAAYRRALDGDDGLEMPIRAVLVRAPVAVYWAP